MSRVTTEGRGSLSNKYFRFTGNSDERIEVVTDVNLLTPGDIDIRVLYQKYNNSDFGTFMARLSTPYGFYFAINSNGTLNYRWSPDGTSASLISISSTVAPKYSTNRPIWYRVTHDIDNGASGNDVKFWTAEWDGTNNEPTQWTQLGATVTTAGVTQIVYVTVNIGIGSFFAGAFGRLTGKIYRATLRNGIDGNYIVDFNPVTCDPFYFINGYYYLDPIHNRTTIINQYPAGLIGNARGVATGRTTP